MGWIRVSDDFYDNDKLAEVGPLGIALHLAAMGFCNRNLTDGYLKKSKARLLLDFNGIGITTASGVMCSTGVDGDDAVRLVIEWMVDADLWHESGHDCVECHARDDGGEPGSREYLIHDYLKYQPSKSEIEAKAEATRKRVEAWRKARESGNAVGNAVTNDVPTALVTLDVHDTPTPTPTPNGSSLVTYGGGVASVDAREAKPPRPHCSRHEENHDGPCRKCEARRKWDEEHAEDELRQQRDKRDAAARSRQAAIDACIDCDDEGWRYDDRAIKCRHPKSAHA